MNLRHAITRTLTRRPSTTIVVVVQVPTSSAPILSVIRRCYVTSSCDMKHDVKVCPRRVSKRWHSDTTKSTTNSGSSGIASSTNNTTSTTSRSSSRWSPPVNPKEDEEEKDRQRIQSERENDAVVATQVGALANVGLAGTKGVIGYGVNSTALMADAGNKMMEMWYW